MLRSIPHSLIPIISNLHSISIFINDAKILLLFLKVMELDVLSLDSVARFAQAWNARLGPVHVLINNAGIFSIGGSSFKMIVYF